MSAQGNPERVAQERVLDLVGAQAARRLRSLALISVFGFALGLFLTLTIPSVVGEPEPVAWPLFWLCLGMVLISSVVAVAATSLPPARVTAFGHAYVLASAAAMSLTEMVVVPGRHADITGVSGICIWIVLFPMVIASRPLPTLVTAFASASMLPICYLLLADGPDPLFTAGHLVEWFVPGYFCAGLAWLAARSFTALADRLAAARAEIRELSGYRLEGRIGKGGMGEVWRARHRLLPQLAAVKFIRTDRDAGAGSVLAERFAGEARALASLRSPSTVRIYDYGVTESGELFYVMEHIDGIDLERLVLRCGPLPVARLLHLLIQACRALEELHGAGLLHRDIKPDNILLARIGGQPDAVKLIDFGLAIERRGEDPEGAVAGTVGYVAPELLLRSAAPSVASDLYGLGCVGWWLATGQELYPAGDDQEVMLSHVSAPLPEPAVELPSALLAVLQECLAKRPEQRPAGARELRGQLESLACIHVWDEGGAAAWWDAVGDDLVAEERIDGGGTPSFLVNRTRMTASS